MSHYALLRIVLLVATLFLQGQRALSQQSAAPAIPPRLPPIGDGGGAGFGRGPGLPCDPNDGAAAIAARAALPTPGGVHLMPSGPVGTAPDGIGKYRQYENGYFIYWSPATCARLIYGAIFAKWNSMQR